MHILKYLLSKAYRNKFDSKYSKEICDRFVSEQNNKQEVFKIIFNNNTNL